MTTPDFSALADRELSGKARAGHVALLLGSLCMSTITASLWMTEPLLPARTAIAFAVMTGIGLCWAAYTVWTLTTRQPLMALHRVVATRLSMTFCSAATAGSLYLALVQALPAARLAASVFFAMTLVAAILLARARRDYNRLLAHKLVLERRLDRVDGDPRA